MPFEYCGYLENDFSCNTMHAQTCTEPRRDIVVKFAERYGEAAQYVSLPHGFTWNPPGLHEVQVDSMWTPLNGLKWES